VLEHTDCFVLLRSCLLLPFPLTLSHRRAIQFAPRPSPPSLPQEQNKSLDTGPAAYECNFSEASISKACQGLDLDFPRQGSEPQTEARWLLKHPLTWKIFTSFLYLFLYLVYNW